MSEPPHARLWRASTSTADACLAHPFVAGLGDGTLDAVRFKGYVAQDAFFLRAFARAYALVAARAPDAAALEKGHALLGGVLDELKTHEKYAAELGIELHDVTASPATLAYTDFLDAAAWRGPLAVTLAAMAPCMRLYAYLGQRLQERGGAALDGPYRDWVAIYAADDFEQLAVLLESMLDAQASASDERAIEAAYARAMQLEYDFFDGCYRSAV